MGDGGHFARADSKAVPRGTAEWSIGIDRQTAGPSVRAGKRFTNARLCSSVDLMLVGVANGGEVDHVNTRLRRHDPRRLSDTGAPKSLKLINAGKLSLTRAIALSFSMLQKVGCGCVLFGAVAA